MIAKGITRRELDELGLESQRRAAVAIKGGHFDRSLAPVYHEDGTLALDHDEYPRPDSTLDGLASLKPAFAAMADYPLDEQGTTYRKLILDAISVSTSCITPVIHPALSTARRRSCWRRRIMPGSTA